jgi:hypothetical protein
MSTEQRELLRRAILSILEANNTRFGLGATALLHMLPAYGFRGLTIGDVEPTLLYLAGKGLIQTVGKLISPENNCWRITAEGSDWVAQNA